MLAIKNLRVRANPVIVGFNKHCFILQMYRFKGAIFTHMWSWGLRKKIIWPFDFLPRDCLKLSLTLVCVRNRASSVRFSLLLCAGNNDRQPRQLSRQRKVSSTHLRHQPIQSSNLVGTVTSADLIFQLCWDSSKFNLSTRLGHLQI